MNIGRSINEGELGNSLKGVEEVCGHGVEYTAGCVWACGSRGRWHVFAVRDGRTTLTLESGMGSTLKGPQRLVTKQLPTGLSPLPFDLLTPKHTYSANLPTFQLR